MPKKHTQQIFIIGNITVEVNKVVYGEQGEDMLVCVLGVSYSEVLEETEMFENWRDKQTDIRRYVMKTKRDLVRRLRQSQKRSEEEHGDDY